MEEGPLGAGTGKETHCLLNLKNRKRQVFYQPNWDSWGIKGKGDVGQTSWSEESHLTRAVQGPWCGLQ